MPAPSSNIIPDEAKLQLTVRSYTPETRKLLLDGISRIARGEAIAAGMPEDRMPVVEIEQPSADATFNTAPLVGTSAAACSRSHFGADRVVADPSRSWRARTSAVSGSPTSPSRALIFWVGGVPQAKWDAAAGDIDETAVAAQPLWAPDAEAVISTATEAMTVAALDILKKG